MVLRVMTEKIDTWGKAALFYLTKLDLWCLHNRWAVLPDEEPYLSQESQKVFLLLLL